MTQEGAIPPDLWEQIDQRIDRKVAELSRSGMLRNASISGGAGLQIVDGGKLALVAANGAVIFYIGPVSPDRLDGSPQPGWEVRRADDTLVLLLRDAFPGVDGTLNQALTWLDRDGNVVMSDDTDSGEGGARPWLSYPTPKSTTIATWPSTTATSWATIAESFASLERPKLWWSATAIADAGVTGEVRLNVSSGAVIGPAHTVVAGTTTFINDVISLPAGYFGGQWSLDVQAQVTGGAGAIHVQTWALIGRQT